MNTPIVIYDETCPLCRRARDWVLERAQPGVFDFVPCQSERRPPEVSLDACMQAMQLVLPGGERFSGAPAVRRILLVLPQWRWLGALMGLPGAAWLAERGYRWLAPRRMALFGWLKNKEEHAACACEGQPAVKDKSTSHCEERSEVRTE